MIPRKNLVSLLLATIMIVSTFTFVEPAIVDASSGKTLYVGGNGPGNYTTIQSAIDNASDGDTAFVYSGTYNESIVIESSINLIGKNKNTTLIHTIGNNMTVVKILSDDVHMTGFTIKNNITECGASRVYVEGNNCAIYGNIIISNCGKSGCEDNSAVKLYFSNNNLITNNTIILNHISLPPYHMHRGIDVDSSFHNTISNNAIIDGGLKDEGGAGYGIFLSSSGDNLIFSNTISAKLNGIGLYSSSHNNNISKNSITRSGGIHVFNSYNNTLYSNTISPTTSRSHSGIWLDNSNNNTILKNKINPQQDFGILFYHSNGNILRENTILNTSEEGLLLSDSNNNHIINNVFQDNGEFRGIELQSSNNNTIRDQVFINSGIYTEDICHNTIINNTVNGKPLIYLEKESNLTVEEGDAGQIILMSCNNITIQGQQIISNISVAILLIDIHNSLIANNTISIPKYGYMGGSYGIRLFYSNNTIIQDNNLSNISWVGIRLGYSCNNYIANNTLDNCRSGIDIRDNSIANTITNNINSINLQKATWGGPAAMGIWVSHAENNTLSFNNIKNQGVGITIYKGGNNNSVRGNIITNAMFNGIAISGGASYNSIIGNTVENSSLAIDLGETINNIVYHNNFIDNNTLKIEDNGANTWYDIVSQEGNYYSDYDEPTEGAYDSNNDGIIDTPYDIPGGNNKDLYPLIKPFSTVQPHKGDSNNDGRIDVFDLDAFAQVWGSTKNPGGNYKECFDFNDDGKIDVFDLDEFAQEWGKTYT